jgi:endoglucanase
MLSALLSLPKFASRRRARSLVAVSLALGASPMACLKPPVEAGLSPSTPGAPAASTPSAPADPMTELDAWDAVPRMTPGINIGNTLESTNTWETGWGNPRITRDYVESLAHLGFKTVRVPVAWDSFAMGGQIAQDKLRRVGEVVDWIIGAGMFCVVNIHWDGGWIDSGSKDRYPDTYATFSRTAALKYVAYWTQISRFLAPKNEKLIFEALNEETKFDNAGSVAKAYATLRHVNQLFIDTVRYTGGNNPKRLLIVTGYATDIQKTCSSDYELPKDTVPHRLFISVHYYTPWPFCGMTEDADWGKMAPTWGSAGDVAELERLFDMMAGFSTRNDIPAFIGEFGVTERKESASRVRWLSAVIGAAAARKMVPVLWDTGSAVSRLPPYQPSGDLAQVLRNAAAPPHPSG